MKRSLKLIILGSLAAVLLVVIIYRIIEAAKPTPPRKMPTPIVKVAQATHESIVYKLDYDGDVLPVLQANIFSRVTGMLEAVYTDMGHTVRAGQLIALVDTAQAHQAELQAGAAYANAKATEERTRNLTKKNLASQQDLDNAVAVLRTAEAAYESARIQLSYSRITAPFSGYVTKRWLDPGAVVSANPVVNSSNTTIFTIMDIDTVKIDINVLDRDVAKIPQAKRAVVKLDAFPDREFSAFVARSAQAINLTTRTMPVEIMIPNRDEAIKPGSYAHVSLVLGENPDALTVPTEAVLHDGDGAYVLVAQDSMARRKAVEAGVVQNGRTEILSGLDGTEPIIVVGQNFAKPNAKIQIAKEAIKPDTANHRS